MQFYQDRRATLLLIALTALNTALSAVRYFRHSPHDGFALVQAITWFCMLAVCTNIATTRWTFTDTALLQRRVGFGRQTIPYESITSVDPSIVGGKKRRATVILYGNDGPITYTQRLTVEPNDLPGFLAELERHAPHAAIHN
jgi:hypothetical protein